MPLAVRQHRPGDAPQALAPPRGRRAVPDRGVERAYRAQVERRQPSASPGLDVPEREPQAVHVDPVAADLFRRGEAARGGHGDPLLAGHVLVARLDVGGVRPVALHADATDRLPSLVERDAPRVGGEAEGELRVHVAAGELGELHAEERAARRVRHPRGEVGLNDEAGRARREGVAARAEEGGRARLGDRGEPGSEKRAVQPSAPAAS